MSIFGGIFGTDDDIREENVEDTAKLRLRKEELDISKSKIEKGEILLSKEIIEQEKTVDVTITR